MNILLTNDDGIHAEGIHALYQQLKKIAQVTVVAPDSQKSSIGHAITLSKPLWHQEFPKDKNHTWHGLSGTPADCVKFALDKILNKKPDLVISGINLGANDGCSVFYSGTVAGAREGALNNIPSIAISVDTYIKPDFSVAAAFCAQLAKKVYKNNLPKGTFLNVNVPHIAKSKIKGVKATKQSLIPIHGKFHQRLTPDGGKYYWLTGKIPLKNKNNDFDSDALSNKYITIAPIQIDTTDYACLTNLQDWKLT